MYDAIVIGMGGMGSAALYHLARRGLRVLGLERFTIPHDFGSSHGLTRIIRLAYFESPIYVPLLVRAYELWRHLERDAGLPLLVQTGSIDAGPVDGRVVQGSLEACRQHALAHEYLDAGAIGRRFPGYRLPQGMAGVFQAQGGLLLPEASVTSHVRLATKEHAEVHTGEDVISWDDAGSHVSVVTAARDYKARALVITAGPWARSLVPELARFAIPERQVVMWTEPSLPELFAPERFPVFNLQAPSQDHYYGVPMYAGEGFKFGRYHHRYQSGNPQTLSRDVEPEDERLLRDAIAAYFPHANGRTLRSQTCLFTNSPDEHFIIDRHPTASRTTLAAGFSGHGFKFCSVVGEILADLAIDGGTAHDIGLFSMARLQPS